MNNENNPNEHQPGLYRDPESGREIGALDSNQAGAAVQQGWKLVPGGDPYKTQEEMDRDYAKWQKAQKAAAEAMTEEQAPEEEPAADEKKGK